MVYQFKNASRLSHLDANACGEVLSQLDRARRLTPANVVTSARPVDSPLHGGFEWNNDTAAEAYRLDQARYILRSIVMVREEDDAPTTPIRAFVTVADDDADTKRPQTIYMGIETALADPVKRDAIVARAARELSEWQARYRQLTEFAEVFNVMARLPLLATREQADVHVSA